MRELRWQPGQSAEVSLLGGPGQAVPRQCARILELSGKRARLSVDLPVKTGDAMRLEWDGQLLLGQVLYAEPGGFWMEVHHVILDDGGLSWQKNGWRSG